MPGLNDDEAPDLLAWAIDERVRAALHRADAAGRPARLAARGDDHRRDILASLRTRFALTPEEGRGSAPAERWLVDGGPARVGVIASVTRPFCSACDRTRLTADGLGAHLPVRHRGNGSAAGRCARGADDAEIARRWQRANVGKKAGSGLDDPSFLHARGRPMSAIGG
ncbi:hypothetical protein GCM10020221_28230 [Streptomyces thioluteus]|uniref:Molybdenum cofactor biosynthesis protein A-like twitch domain-containing protein n=1 Tax=Streptomyces thioluteus TaxID=66431 RepID=A0ABP6JEJ4_STRTU